MATSAPAPVNNPPNPQVPALVRDIIGPVDRDEFRKRDAVSFSAYERDIARSRDALATQYFNEAAVAAGGPDNVTQTQFNQIVFAARDNATLAANQKFAVQIANAGAGQLTNRPAPTPLATQPSPPISSTPAPVNPAVNPQVPQPRTLPNPAPGESRLVNTPDDFGEPIPPPPGFFDRQRVAAPAPAVAIDPVDITGDESAFVPTPPAAKTAPAPVAARPYTQAAPVPSPTPGQTGSSPAAVQQRSGTQSAQAQGQIQSQQKQSTTGDWRVKLRLAPGSTYLYNDPKPGILAPLANNGGSGGVVFPYTPAITTQYKANYNPYELTHSNYKGYFYQNSSVGEVRIQAIFTAQDTFEANYLLAVIHFFRSVTKMFYGQDAQRGAPPPLVFLDGYGEYQFNKSPCVVQSFDYVLPAEVDYIRALNPSNSGVNLEARRNNQSPAPNQTGASGYRLDNAGLSFGAVNSVPPPTTLQTDAPTYVPTKMEMSIVLLPMQTRAQVSRQFSLKSYANGDLLKGGFW